MRDLRHPISFLERKDMYQANNQWQTRVVAFAKVKSLSDLSTSQTGNIGFGNILNKSYFLFQCRYLADVTNKMRIKFDERHFNILRVINVDERSKFLSIIAQEV